MIEHEIFPRKRRLSHLFRRRPRVLALFSFRYDAHLVPDLIANIRPMVDGWVSYDDRNATDLMTNEIRRRLLLIERARELRADWVLLVDPDERIERDSADRMREMTRLKKPYVWGFRLRELYTPTEYRVDGLWRHKIQYRLFPLFDGQVFPDKPLHSAFYPRGEEYERRRSGLNLYHLKMIARERRVARRDLYKHLDPESAYQSIGYDYLTADDGAVLAKIRKGRGFLPRRTDYGGLWMPAIEDGGPPSRTE
jgi:hypothetical protein